jgi:predicted deacylase
MNTNVEVFDYNSRRPGPTLALVGSVHGNEPCGSVALKRLKAKLDSGAITLKAGKLAIIPTANAEALARGVRQVEWNLNRGLYHRQPHEITKHEHKLANTICDVLDRSDKLLDLHSNPGGTEPFLFIGGNNLAEKEFARALAPVTQRVIWNWEDAFRKAGEDERYSWSVAGYMRHQNKPGITLECGLNGDPAANDVAYAGAILEMESLGIISAKTARREMSGLELPTTDKTPRYAKMHSVIFNRQSAQLAQPFKNFDPVKKGEVLAFNGNAERIAAPASGFAIIPDPKALPDAELVYVAVNEEPKPTTSTPYPQVRRRAL